MIYRHYCPFTEHPYLQDIDEDGKSLSKQFATHGRVGSLFGVVKGDLEEVAGDGREA